MPSPTVLLFVNGREKISERKIERERERKQTKFCINQICFTFIKLLDEENLNISLI